MPQNTLNSTQLQQIDNAVQAAFPNATWTYLEPVGGGLSTSILHKIAVSQRVYVVRFSDPAHPHHNLTREYEAMQLAAAQELAPPLYYADPQTGIALMGFVEGQPFGAAGADGATFMQLLARLVRGMHEGHAFQKDVPLTDKVEFIFSQMRPELATTTLVQHGMAEMRKLAPRLHDPADARPSHGDINPGNLLFDGTQLWLVDWAAAAQENFYFDLACCSNFFFHQSPEAEKAFLQAYFGRPLTTGENAKYAQMRIFVTIYYGLLFVYLSGAQGAQVLTESEIKALPDYGHFLSRVGQGHERLDTSVSQQRLGFVYLKLVP